MEDFTIAIYCFLDDILLIMQKPNAPSRKMSDAQVLTTALAGAYYFGANLTVARDYLQSHHGFEFAHKSTFTRQLHQLAFTLEMIFRALGQTLGQLNSESRYMIDSFPVAAYRNIRIKRSKLLRGEAYRGYNASKREYFYGFKVQVITDSKGIPLDYYLTAGSVHDNTAFQSMPVDLPPKSQLYADSAYTNYDLEDLYAECEGVALLSERKSNSKKPDHPARAFLKKKYRKRIEVTFSEITALFPRKIHAVTPEGFILKIILFICAYTFKRCID